MNIDAIVVGKRHRKDLGDITSLAESIKERGLLQPIGVSLDGRLLFGERRLAACRLAGLAEVPVRIITDLFSAAALLRVERDENTCRKDMTPEELVSLGRALEAEERPKAKARQERLGRTHGDPFSSRDEKGTPPKRDRSGWTSEVVGGALNMSGPTYLRAKAVVDAAEDEDAPASVREAAKEALAEMNATGKVLPAYNKVRRAQKEIETLGAASPKPNNDRARHPRLHHKNADKMLQRFLTQITGIAAVIEGTDFSDCRLPADQISELDAGVRVILAARKTLKENSK